MIKRIFALLFCLALCLTLVPAAAAAEITLVPPPADESNAIVAQGKCGDNVNWVLYDDNSLVLSGSGATWDYDEDAPGFYQYRSQIKTVSVGGKVSKLGACLLYGLNCAESIVISGNVTYVDDRCFSFCSSLKSLRFLGHSPYFFGDVFADVSTTIYYYPVYTWEGNMSTLNGALTWVKDDKIGSKVTWALSKDGRLTIKGSGATWDYPEDYPGFTNFSDEIRSVSVGEGVTGLGVGLFWGLSELDYAELPVGLGLIDDDAFGYCGDFYINFRSSAPSISISAFSNCDLVLASYPANIANWASVVSSPHSAGRMVWVANYAGDDARVEIITYDSANNYDGEKGDGSLEFYAIDAQNRALLVAKKTGSGYSRVKCSGSSTEAGVAYGKFRIDLVSGSVVSLVLVLKGDVNLDGKLRGTDGTMLKRAVLGSYKYPADVKVLCELAADLNGDGTIKGSEGTQIARAVLGSFTIPW